MGATEVQINGESIIVNEEEIKDKVKDGQSWSAHSMCNCFNHNRKEPHKSEKNTNNSSNYFVFTMQMNDTEKYHSFLNSTVRTIIN